MGKKLKITESQLKMLVTNRLNEEDLKDIDEADRKKNYDERKPKDSEMKHFDKNGKELQNRPRVDGGYSIDKDGKKHEYKSEKSNEIEEEEECNECGEKMEEVTPINESIEKIKSEFKRFL